MKKSLIALAVMAAAGAASAQSSVTLFGIVDVNVSYQRTSGGEKNTFLANSGYNSSRLGFRGTEDLGGGLSASFWLEGALAPDVGFGGSQTTGFDFRRRSTVSLAGGWGELRLGRDYVPTFWNMTVFDPFGTNGVGSNIGHKVKLATGSPAFGIVDPLYVRSNNMVQYFLPANLGGFYGQISYAFDEQSNQAADTNAGRYVGGRLGFASGPFNVAAAYGQTSGAETFGVSPDVKNWNIGGQWDFGMAKLLAVWDQADYESTTGDVDLTTWLIGGLVPVGAGEIRLSYGRSEADIGGGLEPRASQWALGYVHNLSKRTALYATYAHVSNSDGAALSVGASLQNAVLGRANASSSGFDLGIRHSF